MAVVCGAALIWALFGPAALWLARHDVGAASGSALETALQNARSAYLTLAAGILAAGALVFTARNYRLSREGQVTDRYTKAIEQLSSDKTSTRIGGIFALERIALDSARDHPTIMEVLSAFLREQPVPSHPRGTLAQFLSRDSAVPGNGTSSVQEASPPDMSQDARAALMVIGRRDDSLDSQGLDLEGANLVRATLNDAILTNANLSNTILREAKMKNADLRNADLGGADLRGAILRGADLRGADLHGADLREADLFQVDLRDASLRSGKLHGASLRHANLRSASLLQAKLHAADLVGANLRDTNLLRADLGGADLRGAKLFRAGLRDTDLDNAYWDSSRVPPPGWQRGPDGTLLPVPPEAQGRPADPG